MCLHVLISLYIFYLNVFLSFFSSNNDILCMKNYHFCSCLSVSKLAFSHISHTLVLVNCVSLLVLYNPLGFGMYFS